MADTTPDFLRGSSSLSDWDPIMYGQHNRRTQSQTREQEIRSRSKITRCNSSRREDSPERPISQSRLKLRVCRRQSRVCIYRQSDIDNVRKRSANSLSRFQNLEFSTSALNGKFFRPAAGILETEIFSSHTQKRQLLSTEYA